MIKESDISFNPDGNCRNPANYTLREGIKIHAINRMEEVDLNEVPFLAIVNRGIQSLFTLNLNISAENVIKSTISFMNTGHKKGYFIITNRSVPEINWE